MGGFVCSSIFWFLRFKYPKRTKTPIWTAKYKQASSSGTSPCALSCFGIWAVEVVFLYHAGVDSSFCFSRGKQLPPALSLSGDEMFGTKTNQTSWFSTQPCVLLSPSQLDSLMKSGQSTRWLLWRRGCNRLPCLFYKQDTRRPLGARPGEHGRNRRWF